MTLIRRTGMLAMVILVAVSTFSCSPYSGMKTGETGPAGSWQAALPAADSPGRDIRLILSADRQARLVTDYRNGQPPVVQTGGWEEDSGGLVRVGLDQQDGCPVDETIVFSRNGNQLKAVEYNHDFYGEAGLTLTRE